MPSRLLSYRQLLESVLSHGYQISSVARFWEMLKGEKVGSGEKYMVLRHDIDTDVTTAKAMWEIEHDLGVTSSYFFRLSTIDIAFMQRIALFQGEASYHYEELATVAKHRRLKSRAEVLSAMPKIRELFYQNINVLRQKTGLPLDIVASHGDFVNRKLQMYNWEILKDHDFRKSAGVKLEVYDDGFVGSLSSRHSDYDYPLFWKPASPLQAVKANRPRIQVLIHPRHWRRNFRANLTDDIRRAFEGMSFSL